MSSNGYISLIKLDTSDYILVYGLYDKVSVYMQSLSKRDPTIVLHEYVTDGNWYTSIRAIKHRLQYYKRPIFADNGIELSNGYSGDNIYLIITKIIELASIRWSEVLHDTCGTHSDIKTCKYDEYEISSLVKINSLD